MLVRQAISFTYQGRPTGGRTELGAALANALLRDYAKALGIDRYEGGTDYAERDYKRVSCYAMEWQVPESMRAALAGIGHGNVIESYAAFNYTPALGKARPRLDRETLEGNEIAVDVEGLVSQCSYFNNTTKTTG